MRYGGGATRRRRSHCFSKVATSGRPSVTVRAWPSATLNLPGSRLPHERTDLKTPWVSSAVRGERCCRLVIDSPP